MSSLIVVDVQKDFCEGGSLAVAGGNRVAEDIVTNLLEPMGHDYDNLIFTMDWHNPLPDTNGGHFAYPDEPDYVDSWPVHCVANTEGAMFHDALIKFLDANFFHPNIHFVRKGQGKPAYSGFEGTVAGATLADILRTEESFVDVVGLALDYCVSATALDAKRLLSPKVKVGILTNLTASVSDDSAKSALTALAEAGVNIYE